MPIWRASAYVSARHGVAVVLFIGAAAAAQDYEPMPNAVQAFGQLASWLGRGGDERTPVMFGMVNYLPQRAFAPPLLRRDGLQPRLGAALEWYSNPRLAVGGSEATSGRLLLAGAQYGLRTPQVSLGVDASVEALDANPNLKVSTLDAATFTAFARGQFDARTVWEGTALVQRNNEPDGGPILGIDQLRFRGTFQAYGLSAATRLTPTVDLFARAGATLQRSQDPRALDTDNAVVAFGAGWRSSATQRLTASLRARQVRFVDAPSVDVRSVQLRWEQLWSPNWLTEAAILPSHVSGQDTPLLWRLAASHTFLAGSVNCFALRELETLGGLGRLIDVNRFLCGAEWMVGGRGRASAGLELSRYRLSDQGLTLQSLRPRVAYLWPLDPANWVQLRVSSIDDRLSNSAELVRDLRLQATFIHTFDIITP